MHDAQFLEDRGAVVGDGDFAALVDEFVHALGAEGRLEDVHDREAGADVVDDLRFALRGVGSFF